MGGGIGFEMAVDERRNPHEPVDQGAWSECEITWRRSYLGCAFVAFLKDGDGEEILRSAPFRGRKEGGGPVEAPDAVESLAGLEKTLIDEGWERVEEPRDVWYARRFRRSVVPLTQRIASYHAEGALIAFVGPNSTDQPAEPEPLEPTPEADADKPVSGTTTRPDPGPAEAKRLEAERREAERQEAELLVAEQVEAERLEAERLEEERLEAERLEAERQEAERLEAEALEAERREAERLEDERVEAQRLEAQRAEDERREAERLEAERVEAERVEAEHSPLRDLITSYASGYDRDLNVRSIYGGEAPLLDPERFARKVRRRRR
jgi:hypothetical protein